MTRRRGITLVELLVVLGVVAALAGLLLPAVSRARGAALRTRSLGNLRQMLLATERYTALFDAFPVAVRYESAPFTTVAWDWRTTATGAREPGPLWAFSDDPNDVLQCPAWTGAPEPGGDPFTGYNYNTSYLGGEAPFPLTGWEHVRRGTRPGVVRRPGTTAVFGAGGRRGGTNKFMRAPGNPEGLDAATVHSGGQAFRYWGGTTVVAWLDGHVSSLALPKAGLEPDAAMLEQWMDYPRNGFLSDDDAAYDPR